MPSPSRPISRRLRPPAIFSTVALLLLLAAVPSESQAAPSGSSEADGFTGDIVGVTGADTWHLAGVSGAGVRVGILGRFHGVNWDEAAGAFELPPRPTDTFCADDGSACSVWTEDGDNDSAAAVHDMAPDAELVLASVTTAADLEAALAWFAVQGVDVVLRPEPGPFDGPGDGSGPVAAALADAVGAGMTVVQAAGDAGGTATEAGSYYRWTNLETDGNSAVEFAPGDYRLTVDCNSFVGLRWDDFGEGASTSNYSIRAYLGNTQYVVSDANQTAGAPPIELIEHCPYRTMEIGIRTLSSNAAGDVLELVGGDQMDFEHWTVDGSAVGAGVDTNSPGAVVVGAVEPANGTGLATYSGRGPTRTGRVTPDLTAPSCYTSVATEPQCFSGTAASAAAVAGAAALRLSEVPSATPEEVVTWLTTEAIVDRGPVGADEGYGAGVLRLPVRGPRPVHRPDARIVGSSPALIGNNRYNLDGAGQGATIAARAGQMARFTVTFQNDGTDVERFVVTGTRSAAGWVVGYAQGTQNVTAAVGRTWRTPRVQPGQSVTLRVTVSVPAAPRSGSFRGALRVTSASNLRTTDLVRYTVTRRS